MGQRGDHGPHLLITRFVVGVHNPLIHAPGHLELHMCIAGKDLVQAGGLAIDQLAGPGVQDLPDALERISRTSQVLKAASAGCVGSSGF